ncbi:hypothetical protein FACS1894159_05290 [Bacteroidia bacterium]|nr:hypothetical protein FACS1894159_05290 [Bacteroidia bacterium]
MDVPVAELLDAPRYVTDGGTGVSELRGKAGKNGEEIVIAMARKDAIQVFEDRHVRSVWDAETGK